MKKKALDKVRSITILIATQSKALRHPKGQMTQDCAQAHCKALYALLGAKLNNLSPETKEAKGGKING